MSMFTRIARSAAPAGALRAPMAQIRPVAAQFVAPRRFYSADSLSYEEFTSKFEKDFDDAYDLYEVARVLNNAFSYDLVPAPTVIERALLAARRVNSHVIASRVFEALKVKVATKEQYQAYLDELKEIREELGISLHEELFDEEK